MSAPDGLTTRERELWRRLVATVRRWAVFDRYADVHRIAQLGHRAWKTPIPKPRDVARLRRFRDLVRVCEVFDRTTAPERETARPWLLGEAAFVADGLAGAEHDPLPPWWVSA